MIFQPAALMLFSVATIVTVPSFVDGHGLMEDPPSRNQYCGVVTKPHEVIYGDGGAYPECEPAFLEDFTGGYSFMSVLTHDIGRMGGRSTHVCGFDSETWQGGATPWDIAADWPTTPMEAGRNEITWNIAWGPHFLDTEEFRYWITKADFEFDEDEELDWDDFEELPFCVLYYSDSDPTANPDVVSEVSSTRFHTFCDVPARAGRHVIYGEWGRNEWTYERFHGCIDVMFDEDAPVPGPEPNPAPAAAPTDSEEDDAPSPPTEAPTEAPTPETPPALDDCNVSVRGGRNAWYAGFDIGFDDDSVALDFSGSGLDLGTITVDSGNFQTVVQGQTIILTKPGWISSSATGYLGFNGNNNAALATFEDPVCVAARRRLLRK